MRCYSRATPEDVWPETNWPDYCSGIGQVITEPALFRLVSAFHLAPVIQFEDLWFTGLVANAAQVPRFGVEPDQFTKG